MSVRLAVAALAACLVTGACHGSRAVTHAPLPAPAVAPAAPSTAVTAPGTVAPPAPDELVSQPPVSVTPSPGAPPVVTHVSTTDPVVFVTIDDGWTHDRTVLPYLAVHGIVVTAFLIGREARRDPTYWRGLVAQGGLIEDHTDSHPPLAGRPLGAQTAEICRPLDDDERLFARRPTLFRPPFGSMDANTVTAAGRCGLAAVVLWNVTVDRGRLRRATPGPLAAGDIILLHWGPGLAGDLVVLAGALEHSGLRSALLENYVGPRPAAAPA